MAGLEEELKERNNESETFLEDVSGLIPVYITTRKELYEAEFINVSEATRDYLLNSVKLNKFEITRESLFALHKKMFENVWSWAGKKRNTTKNIGVQAYKIDEEIQKLTGDYHFWEQKKFELIEIIARLQHRLVWIHPFEGGNGRWSRLTASLIYYKNTKHLIKWPEEELQLKDKSTFREKYLSALREADKGHYNSLIALLKKVT